MGEAPWWGPGLKGVVAGSTCRDSATSRKVKPVVATLSDITSAIVQHYGVTIANAIAEDTFESQTPPKPPIKTPTPQAGKEH